MKKADQKMIAMLSSLLIAAAVLHPNAIAGFDSRLETSFIPIFETQGNPMYALSQPACLPGCEAARADPSPGTCG